MSRSWRFAGYGSVGAPLQGGGASCSGRAHRPVRSTYPLHGSQRQVLHAVLPQDRDLGCRACGAVGLPYEATKMKIEPRVARGTLLLLLAVAASVDAHH